MYGRKAHESEQGYSYVLLAAQLGTAAVTVGTFNLKWAFDQRNDRSDVANEQNADTLDDWEWKRDNIASVLVAMELDIVGLQEIGGSRELDDIVQAVKDSGGPDYFSALVQGTDTFTSQQVALISRFPIQNARRFSISVSKHIAAEIRSATKPSLSLSPTCARVQATWNKDSGRPKRLEERAIASTTRSSTWEISTPECCRVDHNMPIPPLASSAGRTRAASQMIA